MVPDLVDQNMGDDVAERLVVFGPIVEYGAAIERDAVRELSRLHREALAEPAALEEAEEIEGRLKRHVLEDVVGGEIGEKNDDLAGQRPKIAGQTRIRLAGKRFELRQ